MKSSHEGTKFILGGGYATRSPDKGKAFYDAIVRELPESFKVLSVLFALQDDLRESAFKKNAALFMGLVPDKNIEFTQADISTITSQISNADVVFLHGGRADVLVETLKKIPNLRELLRGKVVVGSSAGAYALSEMYIKVNESGEVELDKGLGFLRLSVVAHYKSNFYEIMYPGIFNWQIVDELLSQESDSKEILKLKEGEFVIYHF